MIVMLENVAAERGYRLAALAQRRDKDRRGVQPVVKVVAKLTRFYHRAQIAIGRRDQPYINLIAIRRADRLHVVSLDRAQQLGLQLERQFRDLVEKQSAAVAEG